MAKIEHLYYLASNNDQENQFDKDLYIASIKEKGKNTTYVRHFKGKANCHFLIFNRKKEMVKISRLDKVVEDERENTITAKFTCLKAFNKVNIAALAHFKFFKYPQTIQFAQSSQCYEIMLEDKSEKESFDFFLDKDFLGFAQDSSRAIYVCFDDTIAKIKDQLNKLDIVYSLNRSFQLQKLYWFDGHNLQELTLSIKNNELKGDRGYRRLVDNTKKNLVKQGFYKETINNQYNLRNIFFAEKKDDTKNDSDSAQIEKEDGSKKPSDGSNPGDEPKKFPLNQILYGPPGTGKTYNSVIYAVAICKGKDVKVLKEECKDKEKYEQVFNEYKELQKQGRIEFITFHQSYGYEEFIQGIKPSVNANGQVVYKVEGGVFKKFCDEANKEENNKKKYVFIIDEINRGNVSKIFGELITLIEEGKRISAKDSNQGMTVKLPYKDEKGKDEFGVPDNVYILGTMNTADRSLVQLDAALRRRFRFIEMMPKPELLSAKNKNDNKTGVDLEKLLTAINERICVLIDREHQIGHSYFMKVKTIDDLRDTFQYEIIPLLQEYFYEDYENINRVLNGNGFIEKKTKWEYVKEAETFVLNKKAIEKAEVNDFTAIYGDSNAKTENGESEKE